MSTSWISRENKNGTEVNGQRLPPHKPRRLVDGELVRLGDLLVLVRSESDCCVRLTSEVVAAGGPDHLTIWNLRSGRIVVDRPD